MHGWQASRIAHPALLGGFPSSRANRDGPRLGGALADVTAAWGDLLQLMIPDWPVHADSNQRVRMETKDFEQNAEAFTVSFAQLAGRALAPRR